MQRRIIARVLDEFRVDLAIEALFDAPTIASMALLIAGRQAEMIGPQRLEALLADLEDEE